MSGVTYNIVVTGKYIRIEFCIWGKTQEENKVVYDMLEERKMEISQYLEEVCWERMTNKRMSRVKLEESGLSIFNKEDWPRMIDFVKDNISQFEKAFKKPLQEVNKEFKAM